MAKITVKNQEITIFSKLNHQDYICITDIARYKNPIEPKDVVKNWLRNRSTIEFLGLWEKIHNPDFKGVEFDPELICLSNMENLNAVFINEELSQPERLIKLNQIAIEQMKILQEVEGRKLLK